MSKAAVPRCVIAFLLSFYLSVVSRAKQQRPFVQDFISMLHCSRCNLRVSLHAT